MCGHLRNDLYLFGERQTTALVYDLDSKSFDFFLKLLSVVIDGTTYDLSDASFVRNAVIRDLSTSYVGLNIVHNSKNRFLIWNFTGNQVLMFSSSMFQDPFLAGLTGSANPFVIQVEAKATSDGSLKSFFLFSITSTKRVVEA